ncbi:methionyl-tRNA formyltransferase [Enterobacteriaceae endosymbiont of Macroplea appendiculata]|uniref:methionyl-tRNA formyltransferase n=1 Tax=Enterobacteriaceae endosymbiont of Macroplea appendiculata TaxID=2675790 RepID=UPI001448F0BF|nr:methionyl-tRNA formyltransferase [Enterobacteriaceae endosymbiont of Macroplea appendiculata]QJC30861.1 methionyl-tRNA formyltransferase [Enterobacteriaceae endosymbiont of Macroplea appendiculata]
MIKCIKNKQKKYKMNIIFMGTSLFASIHLQKLLIKYNISCVITKPNICTKKRNRVINNPVTTIALENGIDILQTLEPNSLLFINSIKQYRCDIIIVVDYGIIISQDILDIPRMFCMNVHASLLPRWRGAAPIQRALLANDNYTGITIIKMDALLDHGDIIYQYIYRIHSNDNYGFLYKKLSTYGINGLIFILNKIKNREKISLIIQKKTYIKTTYAAKINKKECEIKWLWSAYKINSMIRAFNPYPGAYFIAYDERYKILISEVILYTNKIMHPYGCILSINKYGMQINTSDGVLNVKIIQPSNKKKMDMITFINFIKNKHIFHIGSRLNNL